MLPGKACGQSVRWACVWMKTRVCLSPAAYVRSYVASLGDGDSQAALPLSGVALPVAPAAAPGAH